MGQERWSTFSKLQGLLQETGLSQSQFVALCTAYGLNVTNATISRALKAGKFTSHEFSESLRPLILGLENLADRMKPLRLSFANAEYTKTILDTISHIQVVVVPAEQ